MQERRATERRRLNLNARWEALRTEGRGAVCDLSTMGCFVLTGAEVKQGELIRLEVHFPEETIPLWGQVVYTVQEIGFALRFVFAAEAEKDLLENLIARLN